MAEAGAIWLAVDTAGVTGGVALGVSIRPGPGGSGPAWFGPGWFGPGWSGPGRSGPGAGAEVQLLGYLELAGRTFSARLLPAVHELLLAARLAVKDLDGIAAVTGPGSFTGLRVGISAVKGLAEVTGRPVVGVSRLALLCAGGVGDSMAVLDAGRGEFYLGRYREQGMECEREGLYGPAELREELESLPYGSRLRVCEDAVEDRLAGFQLERFAPPTAVDAMRLAIRYWQAGRRTPVAALDANYLRRSDAELFARRKPPVAGIL